MHIELNRMPDLLVLVCTQYAFALQAKFQLPYNFGLTYKNVLSPALKALLHVCSLIFITKALILVTNVQWARWLLS